MTLVSIKELEPYGITKQEFIKHWIQGRTKIDGKRSNNGFGTDYLITLERKHELIERYGKN